MAKKVNEFAARPPVGTDVVGGQDAAGTTATAKFTIDQIAAYSNTKIVETVGAGGAYTATLADNNKVLVSGAGSGGLQLSLPAAAGLPQGWSIYVKANDAVIGVEPQAGTNLEGVPNPDQYRIQPFGAATIIFDGTATFYVIAEFGNTHMDAFDLGVQAGDFAFPELFTVATFSTAATNVTGILFDVSAPFNEKIRKGSHIYVKNIGNPATDQSVTIATFLSLTTVIELAPEESALLFLKDNSTADGVWEVQKFGEAQGNNKQRFFGANELDISGTDGADKRTFPLSTNTTVYFPPGEDKACRLEMRVPLDYDSSGGNPLNFSFIFSPETAEVGKTCRLQFQRTNYKAGIGNTIGGVPATQLITQTVPATANEVAESTIYSFTSPSIQAGEYLSLKFARIGTDGTNDTYTAGIQVSGIQFSY